MNESGSPASLVSPVRSMTFGAAVLVALVCLGALATVLGVRVAESGFVAQHWWLAALLVVGLVDSVAGAALMRRATHRRIAWCLLIGGVAALVAVGLATAPDGDGVSLPWAPGWDEISSTESWARPLAAGVLAALVPWELASSGRGGRWEVLWWTTAALVTATVVGEAAGARVPGIDVVDVATWLVAVSATAATVLVVVRWRRARGDTDDALLGWLAAGTVVAWLAVVPERIGLDVSHVPGGGVVGPLLLVATVPLLVVGVVVRAMRDRPGRFHGVAHDVIGWLVLAGAIVVVYTAVVAGLGRLVGGDGPIWFLVGTTGAIALVAEPARRHVRTSVDRLVWGQRDDPLEVVRGIVDHVGADAEGELLPTLVESLRRELRLDAVAIDVRDAGGWRREAASGGPTTHERSVVLEQRGEVVGRLVVGWEHGPHLRGRDERVLAELAGPLALAVGWVRLTAELRRSTIALATGREEERRRLRRDLHDGLGPALTGVSLGLRAAVQQLERRSDPTTVGTSRALVERSADEVDALVDEVKRIVRALRPTVLDQLGLPDAIERFVRTVDERVDVTVSVPRTGLELPAAVEVAVYRIVTEALTNVVRHAGAEHCRLTISTGTTGSVVLVDVVDDGVGMPVGVPAGVGTATMRERATEVGGVVRVTPHVPHGTHVHVRIPLA